MNYNHDTEMDLDWAADQLRRKQNLYSGLPDKGPIKRLTASLPQPALAASAFTAQTDATLAPTAVATLPTGQLVAAPVSAGDSTIGSALSALTINAQDGEHCRRICESLLVLLSDRDRLALHAEFVRLKGLEALLQVVRQHGAGAALASLRALEKLSRTSSRQICACGGLDVVVRSCEKFEQAPRLVEAALKVLHGLTFDSEAKLLVQRRGCRELAESIIEARSQDVDQKGRGYNIDEESSLGEAWADVLSISNRLAQRLGALGGDGTGRAQRLPA